MDVKSKTYRLNDKIYLSGELSGKNFELNHYDNKEFFYIGRGKFLLEGKYFKAKQLTTELRLAFNVTEGNSPEWNHMDPEIRSWPLLCPDGKVRKEHEQIEDLEENFLIWFKEVEND